MKTKLHLLLVSNQGSTHPQLADLLQGEGADWADVCWCRSRAEAEAALVDGSFDAFLLNPGLQDPICQDLVALVQNRLSFQAPLLVLTPDWTWDLAQEALRDGVTDVLDLSQLDRETLERAVHCAIERKRVEDRLLAYALFDSLTGLANRKCFTARLQESLAHADRTGRSVALFLLDLDFFKHVNDNFGHPTGDEVLRSVANRLRRRCRRTDTVARIGGDEFAIIATHLGGPEHIIPIARKLSDCLEEAIEVQGNRVFLSGSLGVALYPHDGRDADSLLRNADLALYQAKNEGRRTYRLFDPVLDSRAKEHQAILHDLHLALRNDEFRLYFQPILDARTGEVRSAEALIRWHHSRRGVVPPDTFIEVAESSGLILPIGEWVMKAACEQMKAWRADGGPDVPVAVNISAVQVRQGCFMDTLSRTLQQCEMNPQDLELEITETALMNLDGEQAEVPQHLTDLGVRLSLDDFGTGYSSLAYLKRLPVCKLKIDRSFVSGLPGGDDDSLITHAMVGLGNALQITTVAEGVETPSQLGFLQEIGCKQVQGFYFSPPLPADEFADWWRRWPSMASRCMDVAAYNNRRRMRIA